VDLRVLKTDNLEMATLMRCFLVFALLGMVLS